MLSEGESFIERDIQVKQYRSLTPERHIVNHSCSFTRKRKWWLYRVIKYWVQSDISQSDLARGHILQHVLS